MGNRGQIEIVRVRARRAKPAESTWLYSHWEGCFLPWFVQLALDTLKGSWKDPERIIARLTSDVPRDPWGDTFRLRIEPNTVWVQHRNVVVDVPMQRVRFVDQDSGEVNGEWTFSEYVTLTRTQIDGRYHGRGRAGLTREGVIALQDRMRGLECFREVLTPKEAAARRREERRAGPGVLAI